MKLPINSIRWRLQLWYAFLLLVAIAGFCLVTLQLAWIDQSKRLDRQIFDKERMMVGTLIRLDRKNGGGHHHSKAEDKLKEAEEKRPPFTPEILEMLRNRSLDLPSELVETFSGIESGYFYYVILDHEGNVLLESDNAPKLISFPEVEKTEGFETLRYRGKFRESVRSAPWGIQSVFGKEISPELNDLRRFTASLALVGGLFWFIGLWGGWWIAGRAIRPIRQISATATQIAVGNLEERIELAGTDSELDQLGKVLNHTFDELQAAMERQRQFTADASHELRTPLTVILSETQRMLKKERSPEEYRTSLEVCSESAIRMKSLVEGLLLLARQERKSNHDPRAMCDLKSIAEVSIREHKPLAGEKCIELHTALVLVEREVDEAAIRIMFSNLIGNAITHHPGNGRVDVTLVSDADGIEFCVSDDGDGIDPAFHEKIFERFFRIDKSRSHHSDHSGLGLALVKMIAENHGGSCRVESQPGKGSRFYVRLP